MAAAERQHVRIANELRARIRAGLLRPGDVLAEESVLAREFDAPPRIMREALGILRADGWVSGRSGAPLKVRRAPLTQDFETVVTFAQWVRAQGREPGARILEIGMRGADELVAEELDLPPRSPVLRYKRLRSIDGDPVMIERSSYPPDIGRLLTDGDLDRESVTERLSSAGVEFAWALHRMEAVAALAADAELLDLPRRSPLLQVRRRSFDGDGRVIEFGVDRYRGDALSVVIRSG